MKRKERHLTVMGWVVVGLLDTLAGVISGGPSVHFVRTALHLILIIQETE